MNDENNEILNDLRENNCHCNDGSDCESHNSNISNEGEDTDHDSDDYTQDDDDYDDESDNSKKLKICM